MIFRFLSKKKTDLSLFNPRSVFDEMSGFHKCGLYYLWPSQKRSFSHHLRGVADKDAAMVNEREFFSMLENCEDAGIVTRYPAPAHLYRQLCGKQ